MRIRLFLLALFLASPTFAQNAVSVTAEVNAAQKLLPSSGSFGFIQGVDVAIDGDTAIVESELNNSIYVFRRGDSGSWQQDAVIVSSRELVSNGIKHIALAGGRVFVQVYDRGDRLWHLISFAQSADGEWIEEPAIASAYRLDFLVDKTGRQLLTQSSDEGNYGQRLVRISKLNTGKRWETEFEAIEDTVSGDFNCITQDRAAAQGALYLKGENGLWVKSPLDMTTMPGSGYGYTNFSRDCRYALRQPFSSDYADGIVYRFDENQGWVFEWSFSGFKSLNFIVDGHFALFGAADYAAEGRKDSVKVYERLDSGQWVARGELNLDEYKGGFGRSIALDGDTAVVSSLVPLEVTAFDLSRYDFSNVTRECSSGYPDVDLDNDGYGWEDDKTCRLTRPELSPGDSNRDQHITVDRTYAGPTPLAGSIGTYSDFDHSASSYGEYAVPAAVAIDERVAAEIVETEDGRVMINVYRKSDQSEWLVEQAIDFTDLYNRSVLPEVATYFPADPQYMRIDLDQDVLAIAHSSRIDSFFGAVFVFEREANNRWLLTGKLKESVGGWGGYATAVDVSAGYMAVRSGDIGGESGNSAKVHIYKKNAQNEWLPDSEVDDLRGIAPAPAFGYVLALDGDTLIVANRDSRLYNFADVFVRDGAGGWRYQQSLYAGDGAGLGVNVDLKGDTALLELNGKVHFFNRDSTGQWTESVVMRGGDLVIRHGSLWQRDQSLRPDQLEAGVNLYPVEFNYNEREPGELDPVVSQPNNGRCVDTGLIGDGWGWDGTESCQLDVIAEPEPVDVEMNHAVCVDTGLIGDGWGWNGTGSCQLTTIADQCIYDFADLNVGWGWNPATSESCPPR